MFGHAVKVFFKDVFAKHADLFRELGVDATNGFGDVLAKIAELPADQRAAVEADIEATYKSQAELAMVNSDKGITNLHVPSDIIIDASMPAMIRDGGKMWDPAGGQQDTLAMIPDRCYAGACTKKPSTSVKSTAPFDPATMGTIPNVGLMAQKAEEYGSHDKTFEIPANGTV